MPVPRSSSGRRGLGRAHRPPSGRVRAQSGQNEATIDRQEWFEVAQSGTKSGRSWPGLGQVWGDLGRPSLDPNIVSGINKSRVPEESGFKNQGAGVYALENPCPGKCALDSFWAGSCSPKRTTKHNVLVCLGPARLREKLRAKAGHPRHMRSGNASGTNSPATLGLRNGPHLRTRKGHHYTHSSGTSHESSSCTAPGRTGAAGPLRRQH